MIKFWTGKEYQFSEERDRNILILPTPADNILWNGTKKLFNVRMDALLSFMQLFFEETKNMEGFCPYVKLERTDRMVAIPSFDGVYELVVGLSRATRQELRGKYKFVTEAIREMYRNVCRKPKIDFNNAHPLYTWYISDVDTFCKIPGKKLWNRMAKLHDEAPGLSWEEFKKSVWRK